MQPHHTMLSLPITQKPKRRTVHVSLQTINKKTKCSPDQVHIRELTVSQGGLGCAIWDGSIVLARWMHLHSSLFQGKIGMELGAGVGVPGIVAARYAKKVVLTDYMEEVVSNLAYNLKLNANVEQEEEDDEERDVNELARRKQARQNVRESGSSGLLDWHAIGPDEEDLERMKASAAEAAEAASSSSANSASSSAPATPTSAPVSAYAASSSAPSDSDLDFLSSRLAALPFTPSTHFHDPTGLGPGRCDFLIGAELIYTYNKHHQDCFRKILQYYLHPQQGRYYCVQSLNREGMPEFISDLLENGWMVHWQHASAESGITGSYRTEKVPKGFVQREEQYVLYIIQPPSSLAISSAELQTLSLPSGQLQDARLVPVPKVSMLRDGAEVMEQEKVPMTNEGEKLVQQLLPKAFANTTSAPAP